ncbi:MAG: hypothetical protein ACRENE_12525, partial [Polyangiaceae bacterium]
RIVLPTSVVAIALLGAACDNAASKEQKAEETQSQADQQKLAARQQAADKTAAAWDAAAQQSEQAQARANHAWDAAASATTDEENDYAARINKVVDDIDTKLSDIRASANEAGGSQRTLSSEVVSNIDRRRAALLDDEHALERATSETWPALRLRIDTDLNESKNYLRTASARMKGSSR